MKNIIKSFLPILKRLRKHKVEIVFIVIALILTILSLTIFTLSLNSNQNDTITPKEHERPIKTTVWVDIGGTVVKPDLYEVTSGARLKQIINLAGGLTDDADKSYFYRNFNLAQIVSDQQKIYIPSTDEINNNVAFENSTLTNQQQSNLSTSLGVNNEISSLININSATIEELDTLTGVGSVTAQKIINNRPYSSIEDLLNKKIVKKNVFEEIKNLITVN